MVNCAGLYVDKIAYDFGFGLDYEILPFRGLYLYGRQGTPGFNTLVYPTPLGEHEFLGVHTTNTTDGRFKLGPTATPGFWKEHYSGLDNFSTEEFITCILRYFNCLVSEDRARYIKLLWQEIWKHSKKKMVLDAEYLVEGVIEKDYIQWGPVGMFAQMVDRRTSLLRNDFLVEGDDRSMHLLNIVSPGWTSALAFTEDLAKKIKL